MSVITSSGLGLMKGPLDLIRPGSLGARTGLSDRMGVIRNSNWGVFFFSLVETVGMRYYILFYQLISTGRKPNREI